MQLGLSEHLFHFNLKVSLHVRVGFRRFLRLLLPFDQHGAKPIEHLVVACHSVDRDLLEPLDSFTLCVDTHPFDVLHAV